MKDYHQIMFFFELGRTEVLFVRKDTWEHYLTFLFNESTASTCFIPTIDEKDQAFFVDMNKVFLFQPIEEKKKQRKKREKVKD